MTVHQKLSRASIMTLTNVVRRSGEWRKLDTVPESRVEFRDLVFTLKHNPSKYLSPKVIANGSRLLIVGNNIFYRAAREAGLTDMNIELIEKVDEVLDLGSVEKVYSLEEAPATKGNPEKDRFVFFRSSMIINPTDLPERGIKIYGLTHTQKFRRANCLWYTTNSGENDNDRILDENQFIKKARELYGPIRSIDGLIPKTNLPTPS
jgi:hypothetical protein